VPPERLRGKERDELEDVLRQTAKQEASHEIDVTVGEYLPDGATLVDIDEVGLNQWARSRFNTEVPPQDIERLGARGVANQLEAAAYEKIESTDLSGLDQFSVEHYGATELSAWLKRTLTIDLDVAFIVKAETTEDVVEETLRKVRAVYDEREKMYPVEFQMELTRAMMAQDPQQATQSLLDVANRRYGLGWDESVIRSKPPQQVAAELTEASKQFVENKELEKAVDEALQYTDPDELEAFIREKYGRGLPFWMKRLKDEEFAGLTRAVVEYCVRPELVQFERYVLLEVLDPAWKDHLYQMDQLRESIGFRAFSQQDPRIEYKREGARIFREMMNGLHEKVAESVFRLRLVPQAGRARRPGGGQPGRPPGRAAQPGRSAAPQRAGTGRPAAAGAEAPRGPGGLPASGFGGGNIVGPGFGG
jgi:preprotein translocase subunit SecA